jgi:hypothetical protein
VASEFVVTFELVFGRRMYGREKVVSSAAGDSFISINGRADEGKVLVNFRLWTQTLKLPQHEAE